MKNRRPHNNLPFDHQAIFGLTENQRRTAQEQKEAVPAPGQDDEAGVQQARDEIGQLFKATYDEKGPEGLITLAYSGQTPDVQSEMKGMLETDPDSTIALMVEALASSPDAVAAWVAFTGELATEAPVEEAPPVEEGSEPVSEQDAPQHEEASDEDEEEEPEFKVGDAIEPVDAYGMSGTPVMVSGIKAGQYLAGYAQRPIGPFGKVHAAYRRVGERLTARKLRALREAFGSRDVNAVIEKHNAKSAAESMAITRGCIADIKDIVSTGLRQAAQGFVGQTLTPENRAKIAETLKLELGNSPLIFSGSTFLTSSELARRAQHDMHDIDGIAGYLANSLEHASEEEALQELQQMYSVSPEQAQELVKLGLQPGLLTLPQPVLLKCIENILDGYSLVTKESRSVIAVDQKTLGYFQSYFGEYGASLTRPLAFKKSGKRKAQQASDFKPGDDVYNEVLGPRTVVKVDEERNTVLTRPRHSTVSADDQWVEPSRLRKEGMTYLGTDKGRMRASGPGSAQCLPRTAAVDLETPEGRRAFREACALMNGDTDGLVTSTLARKALSKTARECVSCDTGYHERCRRGDCDCWCRDRSAKQAQSEPEFQVGDAVQRDDGSNSGVVESVGKYDEYAGTWKYHVREQSGSLIWWNGSSTKKASKQAQAERILLVLSPEEQNTAKENDLVDPLIKQYPSVRYGLYEIDQETWKVYHLPDVTPSFEEVKKYLEEDGYEFESTVTAQSEGSVVTIYCDKPVSWALLEAMEKDWGQTVEQVDEKTFNFCYDPEQNLAALNDKMQAVMAKHLTPAGIEVENIAP